MARRRIKNNITENNNGKETEFMHDVKSAINYKEISNAVCFIKHSDGTISAITTDGDAVEIIGTIEVGKNIIYEDRFNSED